MPNMIKIWPWKSAPNKFKKYSTEKGTEDWLAYVPGEFKSIPNLDLMLSNIDYNQEPQITQLDNGDWLYIGGHT